MNQLLPAFFLLVLCLSSGLADGLVSHPKADKLIAIAQRDTEFVPRTLNKATCQCVVNAFANLACQYCSVAATGSCTCTGGVAVGCSANIATCQVASYGSGGNGCSITDTAIACSDIDASPGSGSGSGAGPGTSTSTSSTSSSTAKSGVSTTRAGFGLVMLAVTVAGTAVFGCRN